MITMSILSADHQYFESIKHQTRIIQVSKETIHMNSKMNCKRLQVGQFWSARPRGHNRWLHQVRANYSCISCHATFQHFLHTTFQLKIYMRYFRQLLRGFVLPIPLFRVVSPGGRVGRGFRSFASTEKRNYLLRLQNLRTCICLHLCTLES